MSRYAAPLYLHAISVLIPAPSSNPFTRGPTTGDQCKGNHDLPPASLKLISLAAATLMNNLSSLFAAPPRINIPQATSWAQKALEITQKARNSAERIPECEQSLAVILFNLGMLSEASGCHTLWLAMH